MKLNLKHLPSFSYGPRIRPVRDWLVLLALFALALLASLGWNLWLYSQVTTGNKIGSASSTPSTQIQLGEINTLFINRSTEQGRYMQEYRFVDPSL